MLQASIQNLFHAMQFGPPSVSHIIKPLIHMRPKLPNPSIRIIQPRIIDENPHQHRQQIGDGQRHSENHIVTHVLLVSA